MRIVAGELGGRRLRVPKGRATRPTADRVREALFAVLGPVEGLEVLDLYAGSGALGIEAASRGASAVTFVDSSHAAVECIRRNLRELGLGTPPDGAAGHPRATVVRRDAVAYLASSPSSADLVFVDPPYSSAPRLARPLGERLPAVLSEGARIVTESDKRQPLALPFPLLTERVYGETRVAIHRVP